MPDVADQPAKPHRTWRPMALWTAAIVLALSLVLFIGVVWGQVRQVGRALDSLEATRAAHHYWPAWSPGDPEAQIEKLGGAERAVRKIRVYLAVPESVAPGQYGKAGAILLLGYCGAPAAETLVAQMHGEDAICQTAVSALKRIGKPAVPALVRALKDSNADVRYWIVFLLQEAKDEEAIAPLLQALKDDDERVRDSAAKALGCFGACAGPLLRQRLEDPDWRMRAGAAWALRDIGDVQDGPMLTSLLGDRSWQVRWGVACALAEIRHVPAGDALFARLADGQEHPTVRLVSGWALGRIGDQRAVAPLLAFLRDRDPSRRRLACEALGDLRATAAVQALEALSGDDDFIVRKAAAAALEKIRSEEPPK